MFNEDEELKGEEVVEGEQDMDTHWTKYLRKNSLNKSWKCLKLLYVDDGDDNFITSSLC